MTEGHQPENGNGMEHWEEKINALLKGKLENAEAESLKEAASDNKELARAIVEAYQLQRAMEHVHVEKAPDRLRRKLNRIPRQQRPFYLQPRWMMAYAAVPLMVISVALMHSQEPSMTEIEQARQELAIAFAYIDRVTDRTSNRIEAEIGGGMSRAVAGSIFETIKHQNIL